ncbi:hypothetical protein JCM5353_001177 [Sporobolomyces roseus]
MVNKPTKQPKKVSGDSRSPSPEFDPQAFQASLDESVNAARELVNSWIPQDFGGGSNSANGFGGASGSSSVQSLKDKARPPRMGLGAQPALIHKQQAEDRKLKERLLGKGRKSLGDEGSTVASVVGNKDGAEGEASESEDEEDSRSRVIAKGKGKSNGTTSVPVKNAPNNPFITNTKKTTPATSTPQKKPETPLFNDPSPSKPSPAKPSPSSSKSATTGPESSKSTFSNRTIAPVSFYPKDAPSSAPAPTTFSKNQRKKLRKQEREQEVKEKLQAESRQEEEAERKGMKRSREEDGEENEGENVKANETEESQDVEMGAVERSIPSGNGEVNGAGPKKKKKKKGKGGKGTATEAPPLLNL